MSLPADTAPYDFAEFERRRSLSRQRAHRRRRLSAVLACAAIIGVGATMLLGRLDGGALARPQAAALVAPVVPALPATANDDVVAAPAATDDRPTPAVLAQANAVLAALPQRSAIVRVGTGVAAAQLEDRIALIDDLLTDAQFPASAMPVGNARELHALRAQRDRLVDSLARVRYAEQLVAAAR